MRATVATSPTMSASGSHTSGFTYTANSSHSRHSPHFLDHIVNPPSRQPSSRNTPYLDTFESYFEDAFRSSPTPPPPPSSFLDSILNPAEPSFLPFGYRRASPPYQRRDCSPVVQRRSSHNRSPMSSSRPSQSSRLPNGYVDLTSEPDTAPSPPPVRKRHTPTPGPSSKRLKRGDGTASKRDTDAPEVAKIEEIDLSTDKADLHEILQKQRVEAVKAQAPPEEKATNFNTFTCVICMDTPTDITATSCGPYIPFPPISTLRCADGIVGHLFCHTCLMEALIAGENRSGPNEPKRSQCPVCRKFINRTKQSDILPLALMKKGLASQPKKTSSTNASSQTAKVS